jgi:hypothetical protein
MGVEGSWDYAPPPTGLDVRVELNTAIEWRLLMTTDITELKQSTNNQVDERVIDRMNVAAARMQKIAEELKRDIEAFKSGESIASIEARRGISDENK